LTQDACVLFVDGKKVEDGSEVQSQLKEAGVDVRGYGVDEVGKWVTETLSKMKKGEEDKKKVVKLWAPNECSWALSKACEDVSGSSVSIASLATADAQSQAKIDIIPCPVEPLKAIKNPIEQQGYRNAYLRDGRAMVHPASSRGERHWSIFTLTLTLTLVGQVDVVARADPRHGPAQGRGMGRSSDFNSLQAGGGAFCVGLRSSARSCEGVGRSLTAGLAVWLTMTSPRLDPMEVSGA
jgi:hypothetical protein